MKKVVTLLSLAALFAGAAVQAANNDAFPVVTLHTSHGEVVLQLDRARAPLTVANFIRYVDSGFYTDTIFHRVIPGFMAQGGGFTADFKERDTEQPIANESGNGLSNRRGTIAMARTNNPHSATAQFFINLADNQRLDPNSRSWGYTVFGKVISGMEVIDQVAEIPTGPAGPFRSDVPSTTVTIKSAKVLRNAEDTSKKAVQPK